MDGSTFCFGGWLVDGTEKKRWMVGGWEKKHCLLIPDNFSFEVSMKIIFEILRISNFFKIFIKHMKTM